MTSHINKLITGSYDEKYFYSLRTDFVNRRYVHGINIKYSYISLFISNKQYIRDRKFICQMCV